MSNMETLEAISAVIIVADIFAVPVVCVWLVLNALIDWIFDGRC